MIEHLLHFQPQVPDSVRTNFPIYYNTQTWQIFTTSSPTSSTSSFSAFIPCSGVWHGRLLRAACNNDSINDAMIQWSMSWMVRPMGVDAFGTCWWGKEREVGGMLGDVRWQKHSHRKLAIETKLSATQHMQAEQKQTKTAARTLPKILEAPFHLSSLPRSLQT